MCTISFEEALAESVGPKTVLLANGFSIAQGNGRFSYTSLLEQTNLDANDPISLLFRALDTVDFEVVMHALEHAALVEQAYGFNERVEEFQNDAGRVREALISAIRAVHPALHLEIPQAQRDSCGRFLANFDSVYTINYDLLLYWMMLHGRIGHDGFGLGPRVGNFLTYQSGAYCTFRYLHGALHLFSGEERATLKRVVSGGNIMDGVEASIRARRQLPLIVAEGTSSQKMTRIDSVPYLRESLDHLRNSEGSLFVYGHSVADNDRHIYDAIFESRIQKLYFCVYRPENGFAPIRERLAPFATRRDNIDITYVDAVSAQVWG